MGNTDTSQPAHPTSTKPVVLNIMLARGLGGIEQAALDYHNLLLQAGYQPISIIQPKAKMQASFDKHGLPYCVLRNWGMLDLLSWLRLAAIIRKHRPHYIITHGSRAAHISHKAAYKMLPLIPSTPGTHLQRPQIIAVAHNYKYRRLLASDHIISITKDIQNAVIRDDYPEERTTVIPNTATVAPAAALAIREKRLLGHNGTFTIGAMGRLEQEKGFDLLIRAVAGLRAMGLPCELALAGSDSQEQALRGLARELGVETQVHFLGWIDGKGKEDFLTNCDVLVIPSRRETFSIALLEAFAYKLPVVVSKTQGPLQLTSHGQNAELFPIDDLQSLVTAITRILQDTDYRRKLAENGHQLLLKEYTPQAVAGKLAKFLDSLPAQ